MSIFSTVHKYFYHQKYYKKKENKNVQLEKKYKIVF
jgi:hypothetical protein